MPCPRVRAMLALLCALAGADAARAEVAAPAPLTLLEESYRAQIPTVAQYSRVHVHSHNPQPGGGEKDWDALVIRKRFEDGPRTAISLLTPDDMRGVGLLTAPVADEDRLALWLYSPEERRARELTPLEADDYFLGSKLNYGDLALTFRETQPPRLLGRGEEQGREVWKIETRPLQDRFYSRIVTWVATDDRLPVKREYYDRGGKLWKVADYREAAVEGIPTVVEVVLTDLQSRAVSTWTLQAIRYVRDGVEARQLSPGGLARMPQDAAWQTLTAWRAPATPPAQE